MSFPNEANPVPALAGSTGYVPISRRTLDLEDYIDLARRHMGWIAAPTFAGLVISIVVAFVLPNTYVSTAEMQITPSQISSNIVTSALNQRLNERISQMQQEILSRGTLSTIIQDPRIDIYKEERARKPLEDVIEEMRSRDIKIQIVQAPNERGASAFTIAFQYSDPRKAQQVVNQLIARFEDVNETTQRDAQTVLSSYVGDELTQSKASLDKLDSEVTKFRVTHPGELPEQEQINMAQLGSFQEQLRNVNDGISRLAQDRTQIQTHIDSLKHQQDLLALLEKDPDLSTPEVRQKSEKLLQLNRDVESGELQLARLRQSLKETHPDIRAIEKQLAVLRKQRDDLQKQQDEEEVKAEAKAKEASARPKPMNYRQAEQATTIADSIAAANTQLQVLDMQRADLQKAQDRINKQIAGYQERLSATSSIESQYGELLRQQRLAADLYQSNLQKSQLAEQNNKLIQSRAGEQLTILDSPNLPTSPSKPNRWEVVGAGTVTAFIIGLALAGIQEARDASLKNLKDVRCYTNLPVLSSIPLLENTMLVRRKRRLTFLAWSAAVIIGMLAVTASLYYHSINS